MTVDEVKQKALLLAANAEWRELDPRDQTRIDCDRKHICGNQAQWVRNVSRPPFSYVCGYHRVIFEATRKEPEAHHTNVQVSIQIPLGTQTLPEPVEPAPLPEFALTSSPMSRRSTAKGSQFSLFGGAE